MFRSQQLADLISSYFASSLLVVFSWSEAELLLNDFSELYQNLSLIPKDANAVTASFSLQSLQIFVFGKTAHASIGQKNSERKNGDGWSPLSLFVGSFHFAVTSGLRFLCRL
jgi:hypothetical protein